MNDKINHHQLEAHAAQTAKPLSQHERLADLAGDWRIEGRNLDGAPAGAGAEVTGHARFDWLPGRFFLHGEEAVAFDGQSHVTLMIFAYLTDVGEYRAYFFDNGGFSRIYAGRCEDDGVWHFAGRYERVQIEVTHDGTRLQHFWERTSDGQLWLPLCQLTSHRI